MIQNYITIKMLEGGELKHVGVICPYTSIVRKCKIVWHKKIGKDYVLKLKVYNDWISGHKFVYRSLEEIV